MAFFTKIALTELIPVSKATDPAVDVIFVHGLDGDPLDTWALRAEENWQTWITKAVPRANIWTLGYRLRTSKWFGGSMPMTTRAVNVLATLNVELLDELPIVFVCHSYGGLLVKQLLRSGSEIATGYEVLVERVAGIVFLGTPNGGSSIADYAKALSPILRTSTAIQEMQRSQHHLQELTYWFRKKAQKSDWLLRAYFETVPTYGLIVVDEGSADIGILSVTPTGVDANHIDICKPPKADFRVKQTQAIIQEAALRARPKNPQSWMSRIIVASNDQLPYLRAQIESEQSFNPRNQEPRLAMAHLNSLSAPDARWTPAAATNVSVNVPQRNFSARGAFAAIAVLLVASFAVLSTMTDRWSYLPDRTTISRTKDTGSGSGGAGPSSETAHGSGSGGNPGGSPSRPLAPLNQNPLALNPSTPGPIPDDAPATTPKLSTETPNRGDVVRRFIQQFDGGDCFFMTPVAVSASAAVVEGFGASTAPFDLLDKAFKKSQGFEASIGVRLVTPPQCPAITFLNRLRVDGVRSPRISLGSVKLRPGETLVGNIENFANRVVELLLVADNGQVQNMSYLLKPGTDALSFAIDIPRSDDTASGPQPQLVMAVATPRVLDSLRQPRPTPADQFFLQALSEAQRANITINASARYFTIQK